MCKSCCHSVCFCIALGVVPAQNSQAIQNEARPLLQSSSIHHFSGICMEIIFRKRKRTEKI